jgi:hypothetical protein
MLAARATDVRLVVVLLHETPITDLLIAKLVEIQTHHLSL